jgi:TRAP-type C4-dicarboxylate transport system substrate-binding protein
MRWLPLLTLVCALIPLEGQAATNLIQLAVPFSAGSKGLADLQAAARGISRNTAERVQVKFVEQPDLESESHACDGALLVGPYLAQYSQAARLDSLPLLFRSDEEVARYRPRMDVQVVGDLAAHPLVALAVLDLGFAYVHSREPLETVAQWQAARLWIPSTEPETRRMAESFGQALVPLEAARVREALHKGEVDAAIVPPLGAILMQWHVEVANVSAEPFLHLLGAVVLKPVALARLDESDQVLLRNELARAFAAVADDLRRKESEALDVLAQNGVARHPLGATPEQQAEWEAWAGAVADRLVAGGFISAGGLEEARRMLADFRAPP